jgi:predicted CXXCH cytochrome family protein
MHKLLFIFILSLLLFAPLTIQSAPTGERPHIDRTKLPRGCASCHVGHGKPNTPMLPEQRSGFCFRCHGRPVYVDVTKRKGYLAKYAGVKNLQREFDKPFRHPIENTGIHRADESIPERDPSAPRHAECGDCHNPHMVVTGFSMAGIHGVSKEGMEIENISFEYELCFRCHANSANLPADQSNKAEVFSALNPSFHPVISAGKNSVVPSLILPLTTSSLIRCTDCHNNDDPSGPKGPHGSYNRHILKKNFSDSDGQEGALQYELCYSCHNRNSILGNESFQLHSIHIVSANTSCRTCHNPHGSLRNARLIDFESNRSTIKPASSGRLEYISYGPRAGECYLNCHGKEHDPQAYPSTGSTSSKTTTSVFKPFSRNKLISPYSR